MTIDAFPGAKRIAASSQPDLGYEEDLVRRAKERSQEAWSEIYERSHQKLFRYVQARVGDKLTAEDLTATVFLEALKGIASYNSRGRPLLAWLYSIARNVVNYHHRSAFRRKARGESTVRRDALPDLDAGGSADPSLRVEHWDLYRAVRRLSDDQREVIILRYFVGLTTPEVAAVVGKRERAVYSLQTRAIKALRRQLD
jgi:RNA polymerase sigma-70 factor, ECF subfamily